MKDASKKMNMSGQVASGVVQHHEIGELTHFLSAFGKNKDEATKTLMTSSLQIVGLEEIQRKYGDRWAVVKKRVDMAVEAFFTKKLGKRDMFLRLDESNFALIFANTTQEEGLAQAKKLAQELLQLLFGEMPEVNEISVTAMALDIDIIDYIGEFEDVEELIEFLRGVDRYKREGGEAKFKAEEADISICYRPMINQVKRLMSIMEAVPCRLEKKVWRALGKDDPLLQGTIDLRAELDFKALRDTETAFKQLGAVGKKPVVMVSADFETLAHAYRRLRYANILKKLPDYSQRHLIINVTGVIPGLLNSRLRQILTTLNPLVLGFTFEVSEGWDDFGIISDLPVFGLSVVGHDEQDLLWIEKLVAKAKRLGVRSCWRDLQSDDLARRAFRIGIDYVSGSVIGGNQIDPITPFSLKTAL